MRARHLTIPHAGSTLEAERLFAHGVYQQVILIVTVDVRAGLIDCDEAERPQRTKIIGGHFTQFLAHVTSPIASSRSMSSRHRPSRRRHTTAGVIVAGVSAKD